MNNEYSNFTEKILYEIIENHSEENIVISPYSILIMLAIAAHATSDTTRTEIVKSVIPNGAYEDLETFVTNLNSKISNMEDICTSNAVIVKKEIENSIKDTYDKQLKSIFDGDLLIDDDIIKCSNNWVNEKTSGMIPEVMDESMEDILVSLINVIVFQSEWLTEYEEDDIVENEKFTNLNGSISKVTMLESNEREYVENEYFNGFVKPYKNGFSYMALLPIKEGQDFLFEALKNTDISKLYADRTSKKVFVNMPEFTSEFDVDLSSVCNKLGIKTLFTDNADFSNMSDAALKMSSMIHKTKITVDRKGTKAVAFTGGFAKAGRVPVINDFREVILDRPFVYVIIDNKTGIPVFVGTVNQMSSQKKPQLDPDLFIHPSDKAAMTALKAIPGFSQVMKALMKIWNEQQYKIINMSTNLKVSDQQLKKYYDMLPPICETLGIDIPEIYIELNVNPNAYTYGDTHPFIVLTSGLFETLPDELIPSVLAHECGHIACHHTLYTTMGQMLLNGASAFVSGLGNVAIYLYIQFN
ncbi:MAG: M48 family metalloprotease [Erysipelotrichaceae bacterium]|nr:M48 family metalloprotease [Erysipelotrichaceae bacterium]